MKPTQRTLSLLTAILMTAVVLAGCSGAPSDRLEFSHAESSEQTRVTVLSPPRDEITYQELSILVDGREYRFGQFASFDDRRYQVSAKSDPWAPLEAGDVLIIPAAGQVTVTLRWGDRVLGTYEANIPDNKAPPTASLIEPVRGATGVSTTPTFRWSAVTDPSGVSYRLQYSIDASMETTILGASLNDLTNVVYAIMPGDELQPGLTYYWRVQVVDGAGNVSPWSQVGSFIVAG